MTKRTVQIHDPIWKRLQKVAGCVSSRSTRHCRRRWKRGSKHIVRPPDGGVAERERGGSFGELNEDLLGDMTLGGQHGGRNSLEDDIAVRVP